MGTRTGPVPVFVGAPPSDGLFLGSRVAKAWTPTKLNSPALKRPERYQRVCDKALDLAPGRNAAFLHLVSQIQAIIRKIWGVPRVHVNDHTAPELDRVLFAVNRVLIGRFGNGETDLDRVV